MQEAGAGALLARSRKLGSCRGRVVRQSGCAPAAAVSMFGDPEYCLALRLFTIDDSLCLCTFTQPRWLLVRGARWW